MLICPNVVVNIQNEMARKRKLFNFGTLKRLVLPLNVGKRNGKTFNLLVVCRMQEITGHW